MKEFNLSKLNRTNSVESKKLIDANYFAKNTDKETLSLSPFSLERR